MKQMTQAEMDKTGWMLLSSGKAFMLGNMEFDIEDIAWSLAKQCRYAGHVKRSVFYPVARHCVLIADWLYAKAIREGKTQQHARYIAWNGLMHDAPEHILSDIVRPMKVSLPQYYSLEEKIAEATANWFDLAHPMMDEIKEADNRILLDEKEQVMPVSPLPWGIEGVLDPLGIVIPPWISFKNDAEDFLKAARKYSHVPLN